MSCIIFVKSQAKYRIDIHFFSLLKAGFELGHLAVQYLSIHHTLFFFIFVLFFSLFFFLRLPECVDFVGTPNHILAPFTVALFPSLFFPH